MIHKETLLLTHMCLYMYEDMPTCEHTGWLKASVLVTFVFLWQNTRQKQLWGGKIHLAQGWRRFQSIMAGTVGPLRPWQWEGVAKALHITETRKQDKNQAQEWPLKA